MNYEFYDEFTDPFGLVEIIDVIPGIDREESEGFVGDNADKAGKLFTIEGEWKTKFNATVRLAP